MHLGFANRANHIFILSTELSGASVTNLFGQRKATKASTRSTLPQFDEGC